MRTEGEGSIHPKIKNIIWRMCRGWLPTRVRFHDKGVQCPLLCITSDVPSKYLKHVFFFIVLLLCRFDIRVVHKTWYNMLMHFSTQTRQPMLFFISFVSFQAKILNCLLPLFGAFGSTKTSKYTNFHNKKFVHINMSTRLFRLLRLQVILV